jgi:hypothetical protein
MLRFVRQARLPDNRAGHGQGRGAVGPEVHVHAIAIDGRRRRRAAVLGIHGSRSLDVKHFDVHHLAAGLEIERQRSKRCPVRIDGGGHPDSPVGD